LRFPTFHLRGFASIGGLLLLLMLVGGCANQNAHVVERAVQDYYAADYAAAVDKLRPLSEMTDENFVLNNLRLGSTLLPGYQLDDAEAAFLRAWEVINSTGVNAGGRTLGAVLVDEKIRTRANFDFAVKSRPQLAALADYDRNLRSNLLLVVDFGYGPRKVTDFDGAIVGFGPTPMEEGSIPRPAVSIDGRPVSEVRDLSIPPVDLLAMAQERKWQSIDTIRTVKSAVGTGLLWGGAITGMDAAANRHGDRQRDNLIVAGALIGTGLLLKATSQADVRQWEMLPRTSFIIPLEVTPGTHEITVEFPGVYGLRQTWRHVVVPASGEATYYVRMQRWNVGPYDWPPSAPASANPKTLPANSSSPPPVASTGR
jgi:hypothetical protein